MALPLPAEARSSLWAQLAPYREHHRTLRWLSAETWHLTLVFLGQVAPGHVPALTALIDHVAGLSAAFTVEIHGGGGRERHGEAVAWLPVREGADRLMELAGHLAVGVQECITSGPSPKRTPAAHLTVARGAGRHAVRDLATERWGRPGERFVADRVMLLRSYLEPTGARYETLHGAALYAPR
jgi:2'-5' RNA ligase